MKAFYCRFVKTESGARSLGKRNYAFFELYRPVEQSPFQGHMFVRNTVSCGRISANQSVPSPHIAPVFRMLTQYAG
jgi:hypothetical protein